MIYYIGGFKETCNSQASIYLQNIGVTCIPIDWNMSIKDIIDNLDYILLKEDSTLMGFSMGSLIALELASKFPKIKSLILCSLTPFFNGYENKINPEVIKLLGKNKIDELMSLNIDKYNLLDTPVKFIFGQDEDLYLKERIKNRFNSWKNTTKEIIEIPQCGHNINSTQYLSKIEVIIKTL